VHILRRTDVTRKTNERKQRTSAPREWDECRAGHHPKLPTFTDEQIAEFLWQGCQDFCAALTDDPEFARHEIQKRIKSLVLTPKETPEGPVLEVSGDVALLRTGDVLVEVESPMEGIAEHYIDAQIALANVIVNPSLPLAA